MTCPFFTERARGKILLDFAFLQNVPFLIRNHTLAACGAEFLTAVHEDGGCFSVGLDAVAVAVPALLVGIGIARADVKCYGSDNVPEGVAIMKLENVGVSITGNSTNPTRFQHPVAGTYKKWCQENGVGYFSVASGGGTGRTLHPDNMAAGPSSYGMTDTMGRMHSDAQFAGSSSVPAHVEMMGLIGAGNNPMVGMTVAVAVAIEEASK